ncbi:DNA-binding response regulator [Bacillus sp. JCM 19047]|uniref:Response regulator transcription factor n=1 Tax=Shouchella miscanthi TaxID=2598861 RepID=A0ABU6NH40_9BACI|nr:response regulator transcription factor [Shouchella miscanthi]MED4127104.1 response regulator transcription factor [Shouchella miscanthi]GAF24097.1 DNA-binding response regulator [Bacillus sp. JCM 19047]
MDVLLVEDDKAIATIITDYLKKENLYVTWCEDGETGLQKLKEHAYKVAIIDLMLPKKDGFSLCKEARTFSNIPIIVVSAKQTDVDKIQSLEIGADDYVTKPFSPSELVARVKVQLRRHVPVQSFQEENELQFHEVKVDRRGRQLTIQDQPLVLTAKEYQLFLFLAENRGTVFTKEELYNQIWNSDGFDSRTVTVHIKNLRDKLNDRKKAPRFIETVWGIGYKFIATPGA